MKTLQPLWQGGCTSLALSQGSRCRSQLKCFQRWFCSLAALAVQSQSIEWRPVICDMHPQSWSKLVFCGFKPLSSLVLSDYQQLVTWKITREQVSQNYQLAIACHSHIHSTSASTSIEFGSLWGHIPYHPNRVIGWSAQLRERSGAVWADTPPRDIWSTVEGPGTRGFAVCWWWYSLVI